MKLREDMGIVKPPLKDPGFAPSHVGANMYNSAFIIGEKALVLFAAELGSTGMV